MSPRKFDRYMVQVGIGTNRKLRRLPVAHRWAYVAGVLSLAAQSPMRGALLIHDGEHVTDADVAEEATVPVKDARAALQAFRRLGMLERDHDGVEWVHDWDEMNPDPRPSDAPERTRERKRKERASRNGHADVTRDLGGLSRESHDPEVEVEVEEHPPAPQEGEKRVTFARRRVPAARLAMAERLLAEFNNQASTSHGAYTGRNEASESLRRIIGALTDHPDVSEQQWTAAIRWRLTAPNPFWDGKPDTGVVFGPKVASANLASAAQQPARRPMDDPDLRRKVLG